MSALLGGATMWFARFMRPVGIPLTPLLCEPALRLSGSILFDRPYGRRNARDPKELLYIGIRS